MDLLDIAFSRASKRASMFKDKKEKDLERIETVHKVLHKKFDEILKETDLGKFSDFQKELLATMMDLRALKRMRKQIADCKKILSKLRREHRKKIFATQNFREWEKIRKAFYGRVSSLVKSIDLSPYMEFKKAIRKMPKPKNMETIIIAGFPNVGKSQILKGLSGSKVKTAPYPFTTKQILIGYAKIGKKDIQLIDTPGLLDREKWNPIEKRAILALKYLSNKILYVMDPSETCGFPLEKQRMLAKKIRKMFECEMITVCTKKDIVEKDIPCDIYINALDKEDIERLRKMLEKFITSGQ